MFGGDTKEEEEDEEAATERIVKRATAFQQVGGEGDKLSEMVEDLPREWKIVQVSAKPSFRTHFKKEPLDEPAKGPNPTLLVTSVFCGPASDPPKAAPSSNARKAKAKTTTMVDSHEGFSAAVCTVDPLDNLGGEMSTVMKELSDIVAQHKYDGDFSQRFLALN